MNNLRCQVHPLCVPVALVLALTGTFLAQPARAQTTYGSIGGNVSDPSAAPIAGAQVTLTNLGTTDKRTQATGNDGLYLFVNLLPGRYAIAIEKSGFKRYTRPEVVVEVNQSAHIDASMQVGDVNQVVEVTGET